MVLETNKGGIMTAHEGDEKIPLLVSRPTAAKE